MKINKESQIDYYKIVEKRKMILATGLTWIFGVIQISYPHIVLEYLFALTNTLQVHNIASGAYFKVLTISFRAVIMFEHVVLLRLKQDLKYQC